MRIIGLLLATLLLISACQEEQKTTPATTTTVSTEGNNSPAINAGGDATIVVINNYHGANAEEVEKLQKALDLSNAAIKPLLELLDVENIPPAKRTERFAELANQYKALQDRLKQYEKGDEFAQQAERYLEEGKLAEAEKALEAANKHDLSLIEERKKDIAKRTFDLASISELQLNYDRAIDRYKTVTELDPTNLGAWLQLGRLSERIGNTQQALEAYRQLKQYAKDLQSDSFEHIGLGEEADILSKHGNTAEALLIYQEISQMLVQKKQQYPDETHWEQQLSVSYNRIGNMHKANGDGEKAIEFYEKDLEIAKTLAKRDPNNSDWQRDLSVSYDRIGDMHKANGDGEKAIQAYQDSLSIREMLAKRDPNNSDWQRDLSVSYERIGDMHKANGDGEKAIQAYQDPLHIMKSLIKTDPNRADWQVHIAVTYSLIIRVYESGDKAKEYAKKGLKILEELHSKQRLPKAFDHRWWFEERLKTLK